MKVDERALGGIRVKVERAHQHFLTLHDEMTSWDQRQPYRLAEEVRANGAQHIRRLFTTEPIPLEWGVILGEAVHDLRSALDQAVYWLTVDNMHVDLDRTGFPVFTRRLKLGREMGFADVSRKFPDGIYGSGLFQIRGVGPGPRAFIERIQPYPQRNGPLPKALLALHDLWNQDKHRLIHLWKLMFAPEKITVSGKGARSSCTLWFAHHALDSGAIAVKVTVDPPKPHVEVHGKSRVHLVLKNPGRHRREATVTLMDMFWDTAGIVARLVNAVGRQDEPVPLDEIPEADWGAWLIVK